MPKLEFVSQSSAKADNPELSSEGLTNCYAEMAAPGGRAAYRIIPCVGYGETPIADIGKPVRAAISAENIIYIVAGGRLYSLTTAGTLTNLAAVPDDQATFMAFLNGKITVVAAGFRYVWDGTSINLQSDGAFFLTGSCDVLGQRIITSEVGGQKFDWTGLLDAEDLDALNFASKGEKPDDILSVRVLDSNIFAFGEKTTEVFYQVANPGNSSEVFSRIPNAVWERGILRKQLSLSFNDRMMFIGNDRKVYLVEGTGYREVSNEGLRRAIVQEIPEKLHAYEADGQHFMTVWFRNQKAWTLCMDTMMWHERSTGVENGPWEIIDCVPADDDYFGITTTGKVYKFEDVYADGAIAMRRLMTSKPLDAQGPKARIAKIEPFIRQGDVGLDRAAAWAFRYSKDGGNTWCDWRLRDLGAQGEYGGRSIIRNVGVFRQFIMQIALTDPVPMPVESACVVEFN